MEVIFQENCKLFCVPQIRDRKINDHTVALCSGCALDGQIGVIHRARDIRGDVFAVFVEKGAVCAHFLSCRGLKLGADLGISLFIRRIERVCDVFIEIEIAAVSNIFIIRCRADQKCNKICLILARDASLMCHFVRGGIGESVIGEIDVDICLAREIGINARNMGVSPGLGKHYGLDAGRETRNESVLIADLVISLDKLFAEFAVAIWHHA